MKASINKRYRVLFAAVIAIVLCLAAPCAAQAATGDAMLKASGGALELATQATVTKSVTMYYDSSTKSIKVLKATGLVAKRAKWTSSNTAVVSVKTGKATAKKTGKATIKAKVGTKTFTFKVTSKKVSINKKTATLEVGKTLSLKLTGDLIASAKSSKSTVASVSRTGKVTAKKAGTTTITLTGKNGKKYKCAVTVKAADVVDDLAVTGAKINTVVLETEFFEDDWGDEIGYVMHLKVKDGYQKSDKWAKYFTPVVAAGATYELKLNGGEDWGGSTVGTAELTVTAGKSTRTYYVEVYAASDVKTFGVFEGNTAKQ